MLRRGGGDMRNVLCVGLMVVASGCGDSGSLASGSAGGVSSRDGGAGGGEAGGPSVPKGPRERGTIDAMRDGRVTAEGLSDRWSVQFQYGVLDESRTWADCVPEIIDNCRVYECTEFERYGSIYQYQSIAAGAVTIAGGSEAVTFVPDGAEYPIDWVEGDGLFVPGDTVEATVTGDGDIPPHSLSAVAPSDITILSPDIAPATMGWYEPVVTVERSQDLVVRWTPGAEGTVSFTLTAHDLYGELFTGVSCDAAASAGSMTIPSPILSRVESTESETTALFAIGVYNQAETMAGDCQVTLYVSGVSLTPDGDPTQGAAAVL